VPPASVKRILLLREIAQRAQSLEAQLTAVVP
jgi:hypothetical protein